MYLCLWCKYVYCVNMYAGVYCPFSHLIFIYLFIFAHLYWLFCAKDRYSSLSLLFLSFVNCCFSFLGENLSARFSLNGKPGLPITGKGNGSWVKQNSVPILLLQERSTWSARNIDSPLSVGSQRGSGQELGGTQRSPNYQIRIFYKFGCWYSSISKDWITVDCRFQK